MSLQKSPSGDPRGGQPHLQRTCKLLHPQGHLPGGLSRPGPLRRVGKAGVLAVAAERSPGPLPHKKTLPRAASASHGLAAPDRPVYLESFLLHGRVKPPHCRAQGCAPDACGQRALLWVQRRKERGTPALGKMTNTHRCVPKEGHHQRRGWQRWEQLPRGLSSITPPALGAAWPVGQLLPAQASPSATRFLKNPMCLK